MNEKLIPLLNLKMNLFKSEQQQNVFLNTSERRSDLNLNAQFAFYVAEEKLLEIFRTFNQ